ncbi:MAG: DUF167 domain-containing protein [Acidimicrobiales bacterium]
MGHDVYEVGEDGTVTVRVHVQPAAGRSTVVGRHGNALKLRVGAPPEGGRANQACVALLAETFGVAARAVTLVSGARSRSKRFAVAGIEDEQARRVVDLALEGAPSEIAGERRRHR